MPSVLIETRRQRSLLDERALIDAVHLDIPADHTNVLVRESPPINWGLRGGEAAGDIDLGFKIAV